MGNDEFTKLFKYMQERFDKIDERLDNTMTKADGQRLYDLVDGLVDRLDTDETERAAMNAQLTRHEHSIDSLDGRVAKLEARAT